MPITIGGILVKNTDHTILPVEEALNLLIQEIKLITSEIAVELQSQVPQVDGQLFERLVNAHLSQLSESGMVFVTIINKHAAGTLDNSTLLALAQWT